MTRGRHLLRAALFAGTLLAAVCPVSATDVAPDRPVPEPDADGFITLFNGHDLAGWTGLAEYWSVRDGSISGHQTKDMSRQTFLVFSALKVTDFELHLKCRFASPEGNSGIQFRSMVLDPETYRVGGYQADFDAEAEYTAPFTTKRASQETAAP